MKDSLFPAHRYECNAIPMKLMDVVVIFSDSDKLWISKYLSTQNSHVSGFSLSNTSISTFLNLLRSSYPSSTLEHWLPSPSKYFLFTCNGFSVDGYLALIPFANEDIAFWISVVMTLRSSNLWNITLILRCCFLITFLCSSNCGRTLPFLPLPSLLHPNRVAY